MYFENLHYCDIKDMKSCNIIINIENEFVEKKLLIIIRINELYAFY